MKGITFFVIFVIVSIQKAKGQQSCSTTLVTNGYCVKSDDCPPIKAVVDKPQKRRVDSLYIKESYCGKIKGKPQLIKVCCSKTDAVLGCDLPKQPEVGTYSLLTSTPHTGNRVPIGTFIKYICDPKSTDETPDVKYLSYCQDDGEWSEVESCKAGNCPDLKSKTVKFVCTHYAKTIPCENFVEGNNALPLCKNGHFPKPGTLLQLMSCKNGTWDRPMPECVAECGKEVATAQALIFSGINEGERNSPWHVAVYKKRESINQYICGGTIITNTIIVSAAHCFSEGSTGRVLPADDYSIIAGIKINKWDSFEATAQKSGVKTVNVPDTYLGLNGNLMNNIAVVVLKTELDFTNYVHPACLDIESKYKMDDGVLGKIAGWGITNENGSQPSENLLVARMPIVSFKTCYSEARQDFKSFVTSDKVCGGFRNGTTPCKGDSGGGLMIPYEENQKIKYYLKGILSTGEIGDKGTCRLDSYVTFTDVQHYIRFIQNIIDQNK